MQHACNVDMNSLTLRLRAEKESSQSYPSQMIQECYVVHIKWLSSYDISLPLLNKESFIISKIMCRMVKMNEVW